MKRIGLALIRFYQVAISPMIGPSCRYYPTCSQYAIEAIERFGFIKGSYLALKRVLRCHPFCEGGIDHVPDIGHNACGHKHSKVSSETSSH